MAGSSSRLGGKRTWYEIQMSPFSSVSAAVKDKMGVRLAQNLCTAEDWQDLAERLNFDKDDIERIRQESAKVGRTAGRILLDELDRRGQFCTVKTVEDCLISMDRHDVIEVLHNTGTSFCTLTCSLIIGQEHVDLSCYKICEEISLEEALQENLRKKNLDKTELEFQQIPSIFVDWNEKVKKFKGYHIWLRKKKVTADGEGIPDVPSVKMLASPEKTPDRKNSGCCRLECTLLDSYIQLDLQEPNVPASVTLQDALGHHVFSRGLSLDDVEFENIPDVVLNWEVTVGQVQGYHLLLRKKEKKIDNESEETCASTQVGKEEEGTMGHIKFAQNPSYDKTEHPASEVSDYFQSLCVYDEASSTPDSRIQQYRHLPAKRPASCSYSLMRSTNEPNSCEDRKSNRPVSLPPKDSEGIYMSLFKSTAEREEFLSSLEYTERVTGRQQSLKSCQSTDTAIAIQESAPEMENETELDYELVAGWHPHLPDNKEELTRVMGKYMNQDGWYLLRKTKENKTAVSVTCAGTIRHFRLYRKKQQDQWYFYRQGPRMESEGELLAWYKDNPLQVKGRQDGAGADSGELYLKNPIPVDKEIEMRHIREFGQ